MASFFFLLFVGSILILLCFACYWEPVGKGTKNMTHVHQWRITVNHFIFLVFQLLLFIIFVYSFVRCVSVQFFKVFEPIRQRIHHHHHQHQLKLFISLCKVGFCFSYSSSFLISSKLSIETKHEKHAHRQ